ncbi:gmc oxidoreductase [Diaporthe amygdali]|uniref:gmc oxidoreductase n=1 Tax=Phomopsis amygdali TaxID=1214568 RepID=UPI0022FE477D|nr:gmc oxidoreductase [Diaporthe amygdali]KAJ0117367.1 gmc oxidoreductase [Diaporthe amygdali]
MFVSAQLSAALILAVAHAAPFRGLHLRQNDLLDSYDYVIVGGGASGLTVANRLSEDSAISILVIEAGEFDANEDVFTIPGLAGGAIGTKYDWNTTYTANPALQNRVVSIPQGKIVGGGTKLNRMVFDRGSKSDFDRWAELGNPGWDYDGLFPYFKKQEIFTPPSDAIAQEWGVQYDAESHGDSGNINVTYSPFFWPLTRNIIDATNELGIRIPTDQASGLPIGGYFCPHNIDITNVTRSSAREAYYNSAESRTNLHIVTGQQVTKLVTGSNSTGYGSGVTVTGVEFAASADAAKSTVGVNKEAILAAGALFTPQILQVSGIGDSTLLSEIGVDTVIDLPAVGHNFEDHVLLTTVATVTTDQITSSQLTSNSTFAAEALAEYKDQKTGPYSSPTGDFLLFLPLNTYSNASSLIAAKAAAQNGTQYLPADTPPEVVLGYKKQQAILAEKLSSNESAVLELIWDAGVLVLGLQHPFSRGNVKAASSSTFDLPIASAGQLANPLDLQLLVEAVKFSRVVRNTAAIQTLQPFEVLPGANITSDADIETFIRQNAATLFHPAGSCKLGPREEGGVVGTDLKVYGAANLRIVDSSVIPMLPATHIMTAVYGVAEKAADIIKGVTA